MSKIFDLPYCTNNLRNYLKPLSTKNELIRLKQYFYYQKNFAQHLIKYPYHRKLISIPFQQSPTEILNIPQKIIDKPQIKPIIIKINKCSTLIATGHGIAKSSSSSLIINNNEQLNYRIIEEEEEDISLSKTYKKNY